MNLPSFYSPLCCDTSSHILGLIESSKIQVMVFILLGMSSREAWWVFNSDSDALTVSFLQSTTTKVKLQEDEIIEYISLIGILNKKVSPLAPVTRNYF